MQQITSYKGLRKMVNLHKTEKYNKISRKKKWHQLLINAFSEYYHNAYENVEQKSNKSQFII